jgi:hypothetical protein
MIELWSRDEYGQGIIVGRLHEFAKAFAQAVSHISAQNLDNALTRDERMKNWDCYMPVCLNEDGKVRDDIYFAGKKGGKMPYFIDVNGSEVSGSSIRIMLGKNGRSNEEVFLQDPRKRLIEKLEDASLLNKSFVFFKFIK